MIAYAGWTKNEIKFFYIPSVLLSFEYTEGREEKIRHIYDPEKLSLVGKLIRTNGGEDYFDNKGWSIASLKISKSKIKKFVSACFKNKSPRKLRKKQKKLFRIVRSVFEDLQAFEDKVYKKLAEEGDDFYDGSREELGRESDYVKQFEKDYPYDKEDYLNDWWLRGEESDPLWDDYWGRDDWSENEVEGDNKENLEENVGEEDYDDNEMDTPNAIIYFPYLHGGPWSKRV
ncbi:hypothetical protein HOD75_03940 [archaeon]|jgi:hypothetical protein|nr:hypothetical protein [archaeon]MBT4242020.1 hypothetical protein [archaeon]MBT4418567.1 hypothetical protein [archaeon]